MILFHGTGYDFDRFEVRLGQGEGTFVFGYGLYTAEHHRVALHYARLVGRRTGLGMVYRLRVESPRTDFLDWHRGGERVYQEFVRSYGGIQNASSRLHALGTPGLSYLDAHSRRFGSGTRNFLIFDPSRIEIIGRMPVLMERVVERVAPTEPVQFGPSVESLADPRDQPNQPE